MNIAQRLRNKVKALQKKPQPEQRTPDWYKQRQTRVTASEAASCLFRTKNVCETYVNEFGLTNFKYKDNDPINPYETREDYIIKKCSAFFGQAVFRDTVFTLWGKKYEEVANRLYTKLNNTQVHEFGLLSHGRLKWLAASPDGITTEGVMLEIKCPKSRKIDPTAPPFYYWVQVQIQLEVCDLEECDFFECEIEEKQDETEFRSLEGTLSGPQDLGILMCVPKEPDTPGDLQFIYPPAELVTIDDYIEWRDKMLNERPELIPTYYFIKRYNNIRIKRSRAWFAKNKEDIKETWRVVTKLQNNHEDFIKYKESIHALKNKVYLEKYDKTVCLIDDATSEIAGGDDLGSDLIEDEVIDGDGDSGGGGGVTCAINSSN
jgi:putative phage-type endonuclease